MTGAEWMGIALVAAGAADCVVALALLGPRIADPNTRRIVVGAVFSGGVMMALLGGAIYGGIFPIGEETQALPVR